MNGARSSAEKDRPKVYRAWSSGTTRVRVRAHVSRCGSLSDFGTHIVGSVWSRRRATIASSGIVGADRRVFACGIAVAVPKSGIRDVSADDEDVGEGRDWLVGHPIILFSLMPRSRKR